MLAEFKIIPLGSASQLSKVIVEILELVEASGLVYQLSPMGISIEGASEDVIALVQQCQHCVRQKSVLAIATFENQDEESQSTPPIPHLPLIKERLEHTLKQSS